MPRWMIAVGDQAVVAVTNLVLSIVVTHEGGVRALGQFTIVMTTILMSMGVTRLLLSDPWLASRKAGRLPAPEQRWLVSLAAATASVIVGFVVLIGLSSEGRWFWGCAIAPLVIVQDFGRYAAFRQETPARALVSDLTILAVGGVTLGVWAMVAQAGVTAILVSWAVGLAVSIGGMTGRRPGKVSPSGSLVWWRSVCRPLATQLAHDGFAFQAGVSGSLYLLAAVGTSSDVGIVRVVQTAFSPLLLTVTGLSMWLVPLLAHRDMTRLADVRRRVTAMLGLTSAVGVALVLWLGPWLIGVVFGAEAIPGRGSLLLAGGWAASAAVAAPWLASIRVSGTYSPIAWTRTAGAAVTWVALLTVPWARGVNGFLGLLALQYAMVAAAAFIVGRRVTRRHSDENVVASSERSA